MDNNSPILSLCIPTWNRAKFLRESLLRLREQLVDIDAGDVEIFVSDNAAIDETPQVVQEFIEAGMPITYNRNPENLGAARNFIRCIQWSHGKYIWLLGDDDFLRPAALKQVVDTLKSNDYGLLHLYTFGTGREELLEYADNVDFLKHVSFYSTFMSGNIFNRSSVAEIENPEQYVDTHLLQMPFYLESALNHQQNALIGINLILDAGADGANNGGYNFFDVFVQAYLDIWKAALVKHGKTGQLYDWIREHIFRNFTINYILMLLVYKQNVSNVEEGKYSRKGWRVDKGWRTLLKYYGDTGYFYSIVGRKLLRIYGGRILRFLHLKK